MTRSFVVILATAGLGVTLAGVSRSITDAVEDLHQLPVPASTARL
jgi:hypothetical protein